MNSKAVKSTKKPKSPWVVSATVCGKFFEVDRVTIYRWRDLGMSTTRSGLYDLPACVRWKIEKESQVSTKASTDSKDRKDSLQADIYEEKLKEIRKESVSRVYHEAVLESRARQLKTFLTDSFLRNVHEFEMLPAEKLRVLFLEFVVKLLKVYTSVDVEE